MRVRIFIIILTLFCLPIKSYNQLSESEYELKLIKEAKRLKLWEDPYWLKLLYYYKDVFGSYKSQNIKSDFFISDYGRYSPEEELYAHIKGFFIPSASGEWYECKFPLRYRWLRKKLNVDETIVDNKRCYDFEEWKTILNPSTVSIVFASGYLSNPATLYGHTFLILKSTDNALTPVLDYTVNYAAITDDDKGLGYAIKGLFGKYPGSFSTMPYYMKIQEYQNMESRDLWEYPLKLSEEEIEVLLEHLWELGKAEFRYYFFNRNCSWQLLPLFEIVRPNEKLVSRYDVWNIPSDTLKLIVERFGSKDTYIYRPSLYSSLKNKLANLSDEEKGYFFKISSDTSALNNLALPDSSKLKVLDSLSDYLSFLHYCGKITQKEMDERINPVLYELNRIKTDDVKSLYRDIIKKPAAPLQSRNSMLLSYSYENYKGYILDNITFRPVLGDLSDFNEGYTEDAVLEMGRIKIGYVRDLSKLYLRDFTLVRVLSLNPVDKWFKKTSWGISFGYSEYERMFPSNVRSKYYVETLRGYSFRYTATGIGDGLFYLMAKFDLDYVSDINLRLGVGGVLGLSGGSNILRYNISSSVTGFKNDRGFFENRFDLSLRMSKNTYSEFFYSYNNSVYSYGAYLKFFIKH